MKCLEINLKISVYVSKVENLLIDSLTEILIMTQGITLFGQESIYRYIRCTIIQMNNRTCTRGSPINDRKSKIK